MNVLKKIYLLGHAVIKQTKAYVLCANEKKVNFST